jgi:protein TonB
MVLSIMLFAAGVATTNAPQTEPPIVASVSHMALADIAKPPEPRQPIQSLVSPLDYPAGATGRGTVGINLLVDQQGRAVACEITRSGGSPQLDFGTCQLLKRRAHFTPAIGRTGNPLMGRTAVQLDWDKVFRNTRVVRMR